MQIDNAEDNTALALAQLEQNRNDQVPGVLQDVSLSDQQVDDLLDFLQTLTDPCVSDRVCMEPWIAEGADPDPDGLRLNAVDFQNNPL